MEKCERDTGQEHGPITRGEAIARASIYAGNRLLGTTSFGYGPPIRP